MGRGLSNKQRVFVEEYLRCWNATQAARIAGYAHPDPQGSQTLGSVRVAELIRQRLAERAMSANEVLDRLSQQGRAEYSTYLNEDGTVDLATLLADGKGHLIKGIKQTKYGQEIEFYDAQMALIQVGRAYGMFVDKIAPTNPDGTKEYGGYREELERRLSRLAADLGAPAVPGEPQRE